LVNKKNNIFTFSNESKKRFKYLIIFLWISLTIHLYGLLGIRILDDISRNNTIDNIPQKIIRNIIIETQKEESEIPEDGAISDKNNMNQSIEFDKNKKEIYNFANVNLAKFQGQKGKTSYIPQKESKSDKKITKYKELENGKQAKEKQKTQTKASEGGGEISPTYIDIDKEQVINLYNNGYTSVATHSKEYAKYFIKMQKKIEKYHREFFPVYQYYQGLLKTGEVVVEYKLDQKGNIVDAQIISSYGSDLVDKASLNSITYAKNFGPLPKDFGNEDFIKIRFHFIYMGR